MKFREIIIETTSAGIELLEAMLLDIDITEVAIEDAGVFEEFLENKTMNWDYYDESLNSMKDCPSRVKVYLNEDEKGNDKFEKLNERLSRLRKDSFGIDVGTLNVTINELDDEDWANNWKKYFKPFEVGKHIIIKPTWEKIDYETDRKILEIDPGASFGTGQHFTTQLCIEQIEKYIKKDMKVLDMGCGSGILSIASIMLGASHVTGVDIDENAVRIAKENAHVNKIRDDKFKTYCGNVIEDERLQDTIGYNQYDMIAVNIIADIIIAMSDCFPKFLKAGGIIVTSGIIEKYVDKVKETLEQTGFTILDVIQKDEWFSITAVLNYNNIRS